MVCCGPQHRIPNVSQPLEARQDEASPPIRRCAKLPRGTSLPPLPLFDLGDQPRHRGPERRREGLDDVQRRIAFPPLEQAYVGAMQLGPICQLFLGDPHFDPDFADHLPEDLL